MYLRSDLTFTVRKLFNIFLTLETRITLLILNVVQRNHDCSSDDLNSYNVLNGY